MPTKIPCYLRTLRREWGLTQQELAALLPKTKRMRVSLVERGKKPPKAAEILAYPLIFGLPPQRIFSRYSREIERAVVNRAAELGRELADEQATKRKHELLRRLSTQQGN